MLADLHDITLKLSSFICLFRPPFYIQQNKQIDIMFRITNSTLKSASRMNTVFTYVIGHGLLNNRSKFQGDTTSRSRENDI